MPLLVEAKRIDKNKFYYNCPYCKKIHHHGNGKRTMNDNFTTNRHLGSIDCNKYKGSIDIIINSTTKRIYK